MTTSDVKWQEAWRIIASRYPPIGLFERLSDNPALWDALIELEQATNPRIRNEVGEISLVPPERRVAGNNASWVMAPFTHVNKNGSRFSDGTYGVYYTAQALETAIRETGYHFSRFAEDSADPPRREDMRVLLGHISASLHDVSKQETDVRAAILHPQSYQHSRPFAADLRNNNNSDGIVYPSVRHPGGMCVGAFWPIVVGIPIQERHLKYEWNGKRFSRYFDFKKDAWLPV
jgi:hypothetical protein